jgi:hypothetical protein
MIQRGVAASWVQVVENEKDEIDNFRGLRD